MKKGLFLLLILLGLLAGCTDSPTEPGVPGGGGGTSTSGYTVALTPGTGSAFITGAGAIPGDWPWGRWWIAGAWRRSSRGGACCWRRR